MRQKLRDKPNPEILTLAEAAEFPRFSQRTLWKMAKEDRLPVARIGNQYRFSRRSLERWLERSADQPEERRKPFSLNV